MTFIMRDDFLSLFKKFFDLFDDIDEDVSINEQKSNYYSGDTVFDVFHQTYRIMVLFELLFRGGVKIVDEVIEVSDSDIWEVVVVFGGWLFQAHYGG